MRRKQKILKGMEEWHAMKVGMEKTAIRMEIDIATYKIDKLIENAI
jgi:hypothetical protein